MATINAIKKISPKKVMMKNIKKYIPEGDEPLTLYRVMGSVTGTTDIDSDFGLSICLEGDFKAITQLDGGERRFRAKKCFVTTEIAEMIKTHFYEGDVSAIEFGFDVKIIKNDASATGYEYMYESLMEMQCSDPLHDLEQRLLGVQTEEKNLLEENPRKNKAKKKAKKKK